MMTSERLVAHWIVPLLLVSALTYATLYRDTQVRLLYKVKTLKSCPDEPGLPHIFSNLLVEMDPETETLYVSGTLNATVPFRAGTKGLVTLFRCVGEGDDTCEKYLDIEIDDFCKHLPEKNKTWSPIVGHLKNFNPHCPVPPGVYELREAPIETRNMKKKYAMVGHWQTKVVTDYKGTMISCLVGDAVISLNRG